MFALLTPIYNEPALDQVVAWRLTCANLLKPMMAQFFKVSIYNHTSKF